MTIRMTLWRRTAACFVAALAVLLSLGAGGAHAATPLDRELRAALDGGPPGGQVTGPSRVSWVMQGVTMIVAARKMEPPSFRECPRLYVCLWQDRNAGGRRIQFKRYGTYKLSAWGMSGGKGASSYYNHQCCGADATLIGRPFRELT